MDPAVKVGRQRSPALWSQRPLCSLGGGYPVTNPVTNLVTKRKNKMLKKIINSIVNPSYAFITNLALIVGVGGIVMILWILL